MHDELFGNINKRQKDACAEAELAASLTPKDTPKTAAFDHTATIITRTNSKETNTIIQKTRRTSPNNPRRGEETTCGEEGDGKW